MKLSALLSYSLLTVGVLGRSAQHVGKQITKRDQQRAAPERRSAGDFPRRQSSKYATARTESEFARSRCTSLTWPEYAVNGTGVPYVDFDLGESYAGLMNITDNSDDGQLYFWFFPSTNPAAEKEILIWLNGGPGCSSLEGFFQENGPVLWQYG